MDCLNCKVSCQHNLSVNHKNVVVPLFPENKKPPEAVKKEPINLESAALMRYVQSIGLSEIFGSLPDPRKISHCDYSLSFLSK